MTDKNKRLLAYLGAVLGIIVIVALCVALLLPPPEPEIGIQAIKDTEFRSVYVAHDLDVDGDVDVDGTLNADAMDIDGAIDMGDQALTNVGAAEFDSTLDADGAVTLNLTLDVDGNVSSGTGAFTITDSVNITGAVDLDSTLNVDGATTLVGNVMASAVVDVGTLLNLSPGTTEVVSAGSVIVPISSMQPITSATAVTCSTSTCITTTGFSAGDVLFLRNDNASDAITIDGTGGTVECKADVALGAADILMLIFGGTDWNCAGYYDNS